MKFGVTEELLVKSLLIVEKRIGNNEPINTYTLQKAGVQPDMSGDMIRAMTHSYTIAKNGFNFPQIYENRSSYFRKVCDISQEALVKGLCKAVTYERHLRIAKRELKKRMKRMD